MNEESERRSTAQFPEDHLATLHFKYLFKMGHLVMSNRQLKDTAGSEEQKIRGFIKVCFKLAHKSAHTFIKTKITGKTLRL